MRRALLDADVSYKVAKQFVDNVKAKAIGRNVINAVKPKELMLTVVREELTTLMGGTNAPLNLAGNPTVILMSGLQGSGKTTFSGKLAKKLKSEKAKRPSLWLATCIVLPQSSSSRCLPARSKCPSTLRRATTIRSI